MLKAYHDLKIRQTDHRSFGEKARLPKIVSWTVDVDELYSNVKTLSRRVAVSDFIIA